MKKLAIKLVNLLIKKRISISFAESCTGGLLSSAITSIPHASKVFKMGLITYSNHSKNKLLKISKNLLNKYGAVSKPVCLAMANSINKIAKTDLSISITGIAGPSGGTPLKPVGLIYIGIKFRKKLVCKKFLIKNKNRNYVQKETVKKTLRLLSNLI